MNDLAKLTPNITLAEQKIRNQPTDKALVSIMLAGFTDICILLAGMRDDLHKLSRDIRRNNSNDGATG